MSKCFHYVSYFIFVFTLTSSGILSDNWVVEAQSENPRTVQDHYLLMPKQYDNSSRQDREEILGFTSETIIDIKHGYISYTTPLSGEVFEAALFKRPDGEYILAYNEDCDLQYKIPTKLYFLKYEDGQWTDVTTQLLSLPINSRHKYKLPQIGTTIKVTNAKGQKMYDLAWKDGKFEKP
jgi:GTPase SAR1 family protein